MFFSKSAYAEFPKNMASSMKTCFFQNLPPGRCMIFGIQLPQNFNVLLCSISTLTSTLNLLGKIYLLYGYLHW